LAIKFLQSSGQPHTGVFTETGPPPIGRSTNFLGAIFQSFPSLCGASRLFPGPANPPPADSARRRKERRALVPRWPASLFWPCRSTATVRCVTEIPSSGLRTRRFYRDGNAYNCGTAFTTRTDQQHGRAQCPPKSPCAWREAAFVGGAPRNRHRYCATSHLCHNGISKWAAGLERKALAGKGVGEIKNPGHSSRPPTPRFVRPYRFSGWN